MNNRHGTATDPAIDVSVVIPTRGRETEVIGAVRSAVEQEGVSVEAIVIDDHEARTARVGIEGIRDSRVRYVENPLPSYGRPAIVRNFGATLASGRYLHFLDDDDTLVPGALRQMVTALDRRRSIGVAFGHVVPFGDDPEWLHDKRTYFEWAARVGAGTTSSLWTAAHILFRGTLMVNSACIVRRPCFFALGGFDPDIPVYEDVDFYLRAIRRFGHVFLDCPILNYRTGKPSLMHNLGKNTSVVHESNVKIHLKYRAAHGDTEYRALQLATKLIPFDWVRRVPIDVRPVTIQ